jgi:hypothetical protein
LISFASAANFLLPDVYNIKKKRKKTEITLSDILLFLEKTSLFRITTALFCGYNRGIKK